MIEEVKGVKNVAGNVCIVDIYDDRDVIEKCVLVIG